MGIVLAVIGGFLFTFIFHGYAVLEDPTAYHMRLFIIGSTVRLVIAWYIIRQVKGMQKLATQKEASFGLNVLFGYTDTHKSGAAGD